MASWETPMAQMNYQWGIFQIATLWLPEGRPPSSDVDSETAQSPPAIMPLPGEPHGHGVNPQIRRKLRPVGVQHSKQFGGIWGWSGHVPTIFPRNIRLFRGFPITTSDYRRGIPTYPKMSRFNAISRFLRGVCSHVKGNSKGSDFFKLIDNRRAVTWRSHHSVPFGCLFVKMRRNTHVCWGLPYLRPCPCAPLSVRLARAISIGFLDNLCSFICQLHRKNYHRNII